MFWLYLYAAWLRSIPMFMAGCLQPAAANKLNPVLWSILVKTIYHQVCHRVCHLTQRITGEALDLTICSLSMDPTYWAGWCGKRHHIPVYLAKASSQASSESSENLSLSSGLARWWQASPSQASLNKSGPDWYRPPGPATATYTRLDTLRRSDRVISVV